MTEVRSEESRSSPNRRRRGEDSSTGELPPMPTSPGVDLQSPAAQNALFSSPPQMHSSGALMQKWVILLLVIEGILQPSGLIGCLSILCKLIVSSRKQLGSEAELLRPSEQRKQTL